MKMEELDRILSSEAPFVPSSGFADSVMSRIQQETSIPPQIPFPWRRFVLSAVLLVLTAGVFAGLEASSQFLVLLERAEVTCFRTFANPELQTAMISIALSLAGSAILFWISLRMAGAHR